MLIYPELYRLGSNRWPLEPCYCVSAPSTLADSIATTVNKLITVNKLLDNSPEDYTSGFL